MLVSVKMITYNHVQYIEQAIEGVLMQKTNFKVELVIGDDCSTDGTTDIVKKYHEKYPEKITAIIRQFNIGSKSNAKDLNNYLRGKYIAICEGDDYWIDPYKLQKQVDFLEKNPAFSMVFHPAIIVADGDKYPNLFSNLEPREYFAEEILENWIIPTASIVFKSEVYSIFKNYHSYLFGDMVLFLTLAEMGKIRCIPEYMSAYRRHSSAITQQNITLKQRIHHFKTINKNFGYKYQRSINRNISKLYYSKMKEKLKRFSPSFLFYFLLSFFNSPTSLYQSIKNSLSKKYKPDA